MVARAFLFVCILVSMCFSQAWVSTESKIDIDTMYTQKYGKPVEATGVGPYKLITKTNDIRDSGFANDSVVLYTGYRAFWLTGDKQGNKDTIFTSVTWLDTLTIQSMDTTSVSGYAVDVSATFNLNYTGQYIQPVVKPAEGTRVGKSTGWVMFDLQGNTGTYTLQRKTAF